MLKNIFIKKLLILVVLFSSVLYAIESGDVVSNTATINYVVHSVPKEVNSNIVEHTLEESDAEIAFLYVYGGESRTSVMGATAYRDENGVWHENQPTTLPNGIVIGDGSELNLADTGFYGLNDTAIIRVVDADQNINRDVVDFIEVSVTTDNGDIEEIRLVETGPNTGIFLGYIALSNQKGEHYDNYLYVEDGEVIVAHYGVKSLQVKSDSAVIVLKKDLKIWIEKRVDKTEASVGELLEYELIVHNDEEFEVRELTIDDALPLGLKYVEKSAKNSEGKINPKYSEDTKDILFHIPIMEARSTIRITFLATVTAGVHNGKVINEAWVKDSRFFHSNVASAKTDIKEELIRSKGTIFGELYDVTELNQTARGVAGVRLYLEDGTYVVTDERGRYHFNNINAGEHVIQVDKALLPDGYMLVENQENSRFAGTNFSQFIHLGKGALKRVDFKLKRNGTVKKRVDSKRYTIPTQVAEIPEYGLSDLEGDESRLLLWPPEGYVPVIPSVEMAIKHPKNERIEIWLNGDEVNKLNYNGVVKSKHKNRMITLYKGVDLLERGNTIEIKFFNKQGKLLDSLKRMIHVSSIPVQAIYLKENSQTVADGKHSPVLAVKFLDDAGKPLRSGMTGTFSIEAPYQTQQSIDQLRKNPLAKTSGSNRYTVHSDGIAYIELQPTTQSGEVIIHFDFKGRDEVIRAWLKPALREWIMVGFAEGSVGYNTLSGHKKSLESISAKEGVISEGRISFFTKGKIKGEWLLSMAYDSGKKTEDSQLFNEIDPNKYYTLYGDSTQQNQEAPSRKKLYVKLEKEQFNILYGDFNTDMTYTELSSYSRSFTGVKSEYHGENIKGKAFIAHTEQLFMRDEIKGDGTSGYYYIKSQNIVQFSDKIKIEVRNRYRSEEILSTVSLQRFKDYEIDYNLGRLYFKEPIYSKDEQFNPRYIVVDYEIQGDGEKHYTYGGRMALRSMNEKLELGGSYVSEDSSKKQSTLMGIDTRLQVTPSLELKGEYAQSKTLQEGKEVKGEAKLAEIEHMNNGLYARAYYREQEGSFGLGQLNENLSATRKIGAEISKEFDNRQTIRTTLYRDSDLEHGIDRDIIESRAEIDSQRWSLYGGYRYSNESDASMAQQFLAGASYRLFNQRLKLSVAHDQTLTEEESNLFPTRTTVGADYAITSSVNLFTNYEWATNKEQGRAGLRVQPWSGMSIENTTLTEKSQDATSLYNTLGAIQSYQVTNNVGINFGYEKAEQLDGNFSEKDKSFSAYSMGVNYNNQKYTLNLNGEFRESKEENKINLSLASYTQTNDSLALALSGNFNSTDGSSYTQSDKNLRLSMVYRTKSEMMLLEKLDFISSEVEDENRALKTEKIVNNFNVNFQPMDKGQLSLQHGIKYVKSYVDDFEYDGLTQLFGVDASYDITKRWEFGVQGSLLYAQSANNLDYGLGIYSGHNFLKNMVFTVGYNWLGFEDSDFSLQNYRLEGAYFKVNMKFDQESLKDTAKMMSW